MQPNLCPRCCSVDAEPKLQGRKLRRVSCGLEEAITSSLILTLLLRPLSVWHPHGTHPHTRDKNIPLGSQLPLNAASSVTVSHTCTHTQTHAHANGSCKHLNHRRLKKKKKEKRAKSCFGSVQLYRISHSHAHTHTVTWKYKLYFQSPKTAHRKNTTAKGFAWKPQMATFAQAQKYNLKVSCLTAKPLLLIIRRWGFMKNGFLAAVAPCHPLKGKLRIRLISWY